MDVSVVVVKKQAVPFRVLGLPIMQSLLRSCSCEHRQTTSWLTTTKQLPPSDVAANNTGSVSHQRVLSRRRLVWPCLRQLVVCLDGSKCKSLRYHHISTSLCLRPYPECDLHYDAPTAAISLSLTSHSSSHWTFAVTSRKLLSQWID